LKHARDLFVIQVIIEWNPSQVSGYELTLNQMKKAKVVLVLVVIVLAIASFSCNRKLCPAYAKADTEQSQRG
jgi:hypothetical protein